MINKRWALIGALVLAAAFVLAACGTGAVQTVIVTEIVEGEVVEVPVTVAPEAPVQDTIIICMAQEPDSLYQVVSTMAVSSQVAHAFSGKNWITDRAFFYETQMLVNNEFPTLDNGGAELTGEGSDAVLTITYQYKPEITWSDGTPFTVDDIIFTREVVLDPDSGATGRGLLEQATFEKIDDHTLKVTLEPGLTPATYFLPLFGPFNDVADILPKHALEDMAPADIIESDYARGPSPVLGPYQVVEWVEGDRIVLEAVDNWWGGEVTTPNLIYRFISDTNQLLASTLSGECDYATSDGLQLTQLPFIQQSAAQGLIAYDAIPSLVWEHIDMNTWPVESGTERNGVPFFADQRVRQAVAYGTNRQQMVEQILYGEVTVLTSNLPSDHWAWNPETEGMYPYDPEQAKALLEEAGWVDSNGDGVREASSTLTGEYSCGRGSWTIPAGTVFEVDFHTTTGNAMRQQLSTIFQSNMADIGIKVNLDLLPASVWFADDGPLNTRTYQIGEFAWVTSPDPDSKTLYVGMNIYGTPDGRQLVAQTILDENPDLLAGTGIDEFAFKFGRAVDEAPDAARHQFLRSSLPEGYTFLYPEQIQSGYDQYEGQNDMGWCDPAATQAQWDGGNRLTNEERLPFYLEFQRIFAEQVPSLPLFQRVEVEAYSTNLCGPDRGPGNLASWNVETWYFAAPGESCP